MCLLRGCHQSVLKKRKSCFLFSFELPFLLEKCRPDGKLCSFAPQPMFPGNNFQAWPFDGETACDTKSPENTRNPVPQGKKCL